MIIKYMHMIYCKIYIDLAVDVQVQGSEIYVIHMIREMLVAVTHNVLEISFVVQHSVVS